VTFGAGSPMEARILPGLPELGFHGRFWIAPFVGQCAIVKARASDGEGNALGRDRIPKAPPPEPGEPSPQPRKTARRPLRTARLSGPRIVSPCQTPIAHRPGGAA
jgi:hypothetical protein